MKRKRSQPMLECSDCPFTTEYFDEFGNHMKDKHSFICSDCGSKFALESALKAHSISVHEKVYCPYCKYSNKATAVRAHMFESHHVCNHCVLKCTSGSALIQHIKKKHSFTKRCTVHSKFALKNELIAHSISVHKRAICRYCNVLIKPGGLNVHMLESHYVCNHCGSQFASESIMFQHIKEKHSVCTGSKFASINALMKHSIFVRNHKTVKRSYCKVCKILIEHTNLAFHMFKNHNKLVCSVIHCGSNFDTETALLEHMKKNHVFTCSDCGLAFATINSITAHMQDKHSLVCFVCGSKFACKKALREHSISVHKTAKCSYCNVLIKPADLRVDMFESHHVCNHCSSPLHVFTCLQNGEMLLLHVPDQISSDSGGSNPKKYTEKDLKLSSKEKPTSAFNRSNLTFLCNECSFIADSIEMVTQHQIQQHSKSTATTATIVKEEPEPCNLAFESDNNRQSKAEIKLEDDGFEVQRHRMVLGKICRLCGSKTDDEYKTSDYFAEILILTETDTFKDIPDVHPQNLCEICKDKLKETELFCAAEFKPHSDYCSICQ